MFELRIALAQLGFIASTLCASACRWVAIRVSDEEISSHTACGRRRKINTSLSARYRARLPWDAALLTQIDHPTTFNFRATTLPRMSWALVSAAEEGPLAAPALMHPGPYSRAATGALTIDFGDPLLTLGGYRSSGFI